MATIELSCRPGKSANTLVFPYTVTNTGNALVYVMDAAPSLAPETREPRANDQAAVILLGPGDNAILGKFVAPLPTERRIAMPVLPLARRLAPGASFETCLNIPMPMAETSPYFGDLPLRQYELVDIKGAVFTIGYWTDGVDGLAALPVEYAPGLYHVVTRNTAKSAAQAWQRFPANGLQLFKRTDAFPRALTMARAADAADGGVLASGVRAAVGRAG